MKGRMRWIALGAVLVLGVGVAAVAGAATSHKTAKFAGPPIIIGAAVDLTKNMAPFDAPAVQAAQIEIKKINAAGGVARAAAAAQRDQRPARSRRRRSRRR